MTRLRAVYVLVVLCAAAFVIAVLMLHRVGHVTVPGEKADPTDPDAPTVTITVRVECASPAAGAQRNDDGYTTAGNLDQTDDIAEDDGYLLRNEGVDLAEVSEVCGRLRSERLTQAGELGFLGLLLGGSAFLVSRGRRRDESPDTTPPARPASGAVL